MEFTTNQKGGQSLLWDDCRSTLNRQWNLLLEMLQEIMCCYRITTIGEDILQQTNGHNHAVDPTTTRVEEIKSKLGKRAREDLFPICTMRY